MLQRTRDWLFIVLGLTASLSAHAQLDPVPRRLIELGYNQPFQGHSPLATYGFFYYNQPGFIETNLTLRVAFAGVYVDSELGFQHLFGPNTDLGVGLAGGGFSDSYYEVRKGVYEPKESFWGDGAELNTSLYHLFNPGQLIPLNLVVRAGIRESFYRTTSDTADKFELPEDQTTVHLRSGLRFGGQEPSLTEPLAMELSMWQETDVRLDPGKYGFNNDRVVHPNSELLWGRALLKYAFDRSEQLIEASITAGTSWNADRLSSFRLGGYLPFSSEFPLSIPGYFFQELSAEHFALLNAQYSVPIDPNRNWRFDVLGAAGWVDYLSGLEQPGDWHYGAGAGITYISPSGSWLATLVYGHGFEAMRTQGRGADQIVFLFQYDFEAKSRGKSRFFTPDVPYRSPGVEQMFH